MKKILALIMTLLVMSMMTGSVIASPTMGVEVVELKVNGNMLNIAHGELLSVEEGETLNLEVKLMNFEGEDLEDVDVEVKLNKLDDSVEVDLDGFGASEWVKLTIDVPTGFVSKYGADQFLKITTMDGSKEGFDFEYPIRVKEVKHALKIKDVDFSPGKTIKAGQTLSVDVLVDNTGANKEEDVKVKVEISDLGIQDAEYLDEDIDSGKKESTEDDLLLRIPVCTAAGDYTATVTVSSDDASDVTEDYTITVLANDKCSTSAPSKPSTGGKLVLTLGPQTQNVVVGKQAAFPIALTNAGKVSKTYTLDLTAGTWGTAKMSDSLVVLNSGESKVVYAYLTPGKDATVGQNMATLNIKSDSSVLKTLNLNANVVAQKDTMSLRNGLEISLIVLVVVLVIVGLILGFSRLRRDRDDEDLLDEDGKAYY
ncbi:hypothetical protein ACFL0E_01025 [Nanoarchaeota archaeon]